MPKRKRVYTPRRRSYKKRKRRFSRGRRYTRFRRVGNKNMFSTVLRGNETILNNSATTYTPFATIFRLSDTINFSTYVALFDQFRINKVVITFTPVKTQLVTKNYDDTTTAGEVLAIPRLTTVIDRDDNNVPTTFDDVYQRPTARTCLATRKQTYSFKPTKLGMVYRSPTSTSYKVDWGRDFIDTNDNDTPHYGIKGVLEAASPSQAYSYRQETKFYVSFKNRKL